MGRITTRRALTAVTVGREPVRRIDSLAVEEPLEIRIAGTPLAVTMRTPGHDVELAAGFLVSEGAISEKEQFRAAIHCGGPGSGGAENQYNVLDVALAAGVDLPASATRNFYTTSSCGVCGKASIDAVATISRFDVAADGAAVDAAQLATFPDRLRERQAAFDKTGGLHAAALFDVDSGELLVLREDVGRHNAVDKAIGWALLNDQLPLPRHSFTGLGPRQLRTGAEGGDGRNPNTRCGFGAIVHRGRARGQRRVDPGRIPAGPVDEHLHPTRSDPSRRARHRPLASFSPRSPTRANRYDDRSQPE